MFVSVFNDVLGPVMHGPSSSHTAGSYHLGRVTRDLLGSDPSRIKLSFHRGSSLAETYVQQGADNAFVTGLMGWQQTDSIACIAIDEAEKRGVEIKFEVTEIPHADHPNFVQIRAESEAGNSIQIGVKSVTLFDDHTDKGLPISGGERFAGIGRIGRIAYCVRLRVPLQVG